LYISYISNLLPKIFSLRRAKNLLKYLGTIWERIHPKINNSTYQPVLKLISIFALFSKGFVIILPYLSTLFLPHHPSKNVGDFMDGPVCEFFPPYIMTKIYKKHNFVIYSVINLIWYTLFIFAWIYTLSILPWYAFCQWKWHKQMRINLSFSTFVQKLFTDIESTFFSREQIKLTSMVSMLSFVLQFHQTHFTLSKYDLINYYNFWNSRT